MDQLLGFRKQKNLTSRHFLSHDDVGPGTFSQREKAYTQVRLNQARDSVFEKKFHDALINDECKAVGPHTGEPWPKSTKVTNSLQRLANEAIRDSIKKGEFSNLSGHGRPMEKTWENPVLDNMEQKINVMLGNAGFTPEWITLDKEIRDDLQELKDRILIVWNQCGPCPMSHSKAVEWEQNIIKLDGKVKEVNKKIRDRNLKGPLAGQKVPVKLDRLAGQVTCTVYPCWKSDNKLEEESDKMHSDTDGVTVSSFIGLTGTLIAVVVFIRVCSL